jgi:N-acetylgalactosamine-N,N'-diacetylbacillosaminyl-diphospho-undecaprenol 4-alpha-N-acetylgalactosaminyltransferase
MQTIKPKIAFFITRLIIGGAEKDLRLLIEAMKDRYEIHLILTILHDDMPPLEGVKVFYLTKSESKSAFNFLMIPYYGFRYKQYLEKNNLPVSYSQLTRPNLITSFTRILGWHGRIILGEKSSPVGHYQAYGFSGKIILQLIKRLYGNSDLIIPNSEGTRIALAETLKIRTNYAVIFNAIHLEKTKSQSQAPLSMSLPEGVNSDRFTYICVSNLLVHKNQQLLVRAMQQLSHLDCQLWLVGVGEEEENLRQLIKKCGQEQRVFLLGYRNDALQLMAKSDCFVTATRAEGLPNAQIEALTLGLPIISTDCLSGPRELLAPNSDPHKQLKTGIEEGDYGILVALDDIDALTDAMKQMYRQPELRKKLKETSPQSVERFAYDAIMEKTVDCFDKFYTTL